jgi:hypothetical protein
MKNDSAISDFATEYAAFCALFVRKVPMEKSDCALCDRAFTSVCGIANGFCYASKNYQQECARIVERTKP